MSWTKIADVAVGIPYGNEGRKRWKTVDALLRDSENDNMKGPGFVVALDSTFNPAGGPVRDGSVMLSCFHPKERGMREQDSYPRPSLKPVPDLPDDEIPF